MKTAAAVVSQLVASLSGDDQLRLVDLSRRKRFTGAKLARSIERATDAMVAAGVEPGDTVLFAVRPSAAALAHLCGLVAVGARVVLTDLRLPPAVLEAQLSRVSPAFVLTEPLIAVAARRPLRSLLARRLKIPDVHSMAPRVVTTRRRCRASGPVAPPSGEDAALVVFTSGTTDDPKAVVHTQATLGAMFATMVGLMDARSGTVVYSDQFHSILPVLAAGARCVVGPRDAGDDATAQALLENAVEVWFTTPTRARSVAALLGGSGPTHLVLGSAPVTAALVDVLTMGNPQLKVTGVYAMTEAVPVAIADGAAIAAHSGTGDLVGDIVGGIELRCDDDGEVWLRGPRVGSYLGHDRGWIATGDLGFLREDGRLVLNGRRKEMILRAGRNIYPQHYEPVIDRIVGVGASAVIGVPDAYGDEEVWVVVDGGPPAEVVRRIRAAPNVGDLGIAGVVFAGLPRGRQGKLDRTACRDLIAMARQNGSAMRFDDL